MRLVSALRHFGPVAVVTVMWTADIATAVFCGGMHIPLHELFGTATICLTVWALIRRMERRHSQPGPVDTTVPVERLVEIEGAMARAMSTCMEESPAGARRDWRRESLMRPVSGA